MAVGRYFMDKSDTSGYYDGIVDAQLKAAFNERHYALYARVKQLGLSPESNVLDLGCGIGVMVELMARTARRGVVVGIDFSPRTVAAARAATKRSNTRFLAGNILECAYPEMDFDFVTLFDVFEHVPVADHEPLFARLAATMGPRTKLVLNVPTPAYQEYLARSRPGSLQVIDLSLPASGLIQRAFAAGLALDYFEMYGVWFERDYQLIVFCRPSDITGTPIVRRRSGLRRLRDALRARLRRSLRAPLSDRRGR